MTNSFLDSRLREDDEAGRGNREEYCGGVTNPTLRTGRASGTHYRDTLPTRRGQSQNVVRVRNRNHSRFAKGHGVGHHVAAAGDAQLVAGQIDAR